LEVRVGVVRLSMETFWFGEEEAGDVGEDQD
jgi:hypothetical protein